MKKNLICSVFFLSLSLFAQTPLAECWTPGRLEDQLGGPDPIEGFNRSMFQVNQVLMDYVARPVGWIWCTILPKPVMRCIDNAARNLEYPARVVTCLGSAEWMGARDESVRFLANTTIGLAGLFDPAKHWFHFYSTDSNFGRMFAVWGIEPGCTFMLPLLSSVNVRDTIGALFDNALDPKTYLPYTSWVTVNSVLFRYPAYQQTIDGAADPYRTARGLLLLKRRLELDFRLWHYANAIREGRELPVSNPRSVLRKPAWISANWLEIPGYNPQSPVSDTLRSAYFMPRLNNHYWYMRLSLFNTDFIKQADIRTFRMTPEDGRTIEYAFWKNSATEEKLVFLAPGIGGRYNGNSAVAMAELLHREGFSVVSVDNPFSWRFMSGPGANKLPGFTPDDADVLRSVYRAILTDLKQSKNLRAPEVHLAGWSLGGLDTLHIAALEERNNTLHASSFTALNPPADLRYALRQADNLLLASANWTPDKASAVLSDAAGKLFLTMDRQYPVFDPNSASNPPDLFWLPPVSDEQARYLIALSFRMDLQSILLCAHKHSPLPGITADCTWFRRSDFYRETDSIGFQEYLARFLIPARYPDKSVDVLAMRSGLRAIESTLRTNPKIRVFHGFDDFLLNPADREFLDRTLGKKLTWFESGAHCGNFYTRVFQDAFREVMKQPRP